MFCNTFTSGLRPRPPKRTIYGMSSGNSMTRTPSVGTMASR